MRANPVNFERGKDPKSSIGLGGINYEEKFQKLYNEWAESMNKWKGKTITANMTKHWSEPGGKFFDNEGIYTIEVSKVDYPSSRATKGFGMPINWKIYVNDINGERYSIDLDQKIHIK